eukprot:GILK01015732.1.p1 GENE.GILK01015732.1~~GILK01015732.1.p1  ORF type:complete len:318 (-),score=29.35 GILK01015732.1:178-1062(-)
MEIASYALAVLVFSIGFLLYADQARKHHGSTRYVNVVLTVAYAIVTVKYLLFVNIAAFRDATHAEVYYNHQSINMYEWVIVVPLLQFNLHLVTGASRRRIAMAVVSSFLMIVSGWLASLRFEDPDWAYGWFGAGCCMFMIVAYLTMDSTFVRRDRTYLLRQDSDVSATAMPLKTVGSSSSPMKAWGRRKSTLRRELSPLDRLFRQMGLVTIISWTFYPIVWVIRREHPASESTLILMDTLADVISKMVLGAILTLSKKKIHELQHNAAVMAAIHAGPLSPSSGGPLSPSSPEST